MSCLEPREAVVGSIPGAQERPRWGVPLGPRRSLVDSSAWGLSLHSGISKASVLSAVGHEKNPFTSARFSVFIF